MALHRSARTIAAWIMVAGLTPLHGCDSRNECWRAIDYLTECLKLSGESDNGSPPNGDVCTGRKLCAAKCINNASCEEIKDAFTARPTEVSKAFLDCAAQCATASGADQ